jgi:hypothetical protein
MDEDTTALDRSAPGFFQTLLGLYGSPGKQFVSIVRKPQFWMPVVALLALNLAFTAVWSSKVDPTEFMKAQNEESSRWADRPAEQREAILNAQTRFFGVFTWIFALAIPLVLLAVVTGVLFFVFRFFYAGELGFAQALGIVAWSFLTVGLINSPLILLTLALKGDWNLNPQEALRANISMFLDKGETAKALYALASSLDLFSFWTMFLLASGFGIATRRSASSALPGIVIPWAIWVLLKTGWAAIM